MYLENYVTDGDFQDDSDDEQPTNAELPFLGGQRVVYEDENIVEVKNCYCHSIYFTFYQIKIFYKYFRLFLMEE